MLYINYFKTFIVAIILLLGYSCNKGGKIQTGKDYKTADNFVFYKEYIEKNIALNAELNSRRCEILKDCNLNNNSGNRLIFIFTSNDCSTCINKEISILMRLLKPKIFKKQVLLVTDKLGRNNLDHTWGRLIKDASILVRPTEKIKSFYSYKNKPIYVYVAHNRYNQYLSAFTVDPVMPETSNELLVYYSNLIIN